MNHMLRCFEMLLIFQILGKATDDSEGIDSQSSYYKKHFLASTSREFNRKLMSGLSISIGQCTISVAGCATRGGAFGCGTLLLAGR